MTSFYGRQSSNGAYSQQVPKASGDNLCTKCGHTIYGTTVSQVCESCTYKLCVTASSARYEHQTTTAEAYSHPAPAKKEYVPRQSTTAEAYSHPAPAKKEERAPHHSHAPRAYSHPASVKEERAPHHSHAPRAHPAPVKEYVPRQSTPAEAYSQQAPAKTVPYCSPVPESVPECPYCKNHGCSFCACTRSTSTERQSTGRSYYM